MSLKVAMAEMQTEVAANTLIGEGIGALAGRATGVSKGLSTVGSYVDDVSLFGSVSEGLGHFGKHGSSVQKALGRSSYSYADYLTDANFIIKNGTYVPEINGYVRLIGGKGSAKFGVVGLNRKMGNITTFHVKSAERLAKDAPNTFKY